jgi:SNF2-related domain
VTKPYTPRPFAPLVWGFLQANKRCNLWAGMGLGKTSLVETYLDAVYNIGGEGGPTLVLGPLRVARDVWSQETEKWDHLAGLSVSVVVGEPAERLAALRRPAQVYAMNYDNLPWLDEVLYGKPWPFKRVVPDESTRLKNFRLRQGGARAKVLGRIAHTQATDWVNLTGTPSPNGLKDLWGQQWFIDQGLRLGRTYSAFEQRYFTFKAHHPGATYGASVAMPGAQEQIMARLADCSLTIDPKDWFDLKEPIVNVIRVELPPTARRHYRELERQFLTEIHGSTIEALNAASKSMKLLQLANGAAYVSPDENGAGEARRREPKTVEVHDAKLQALESLLEEQGGNPVLCAYHFKSDLARIQRAFPHAINVATKDGLARAKQGEGTLWLGHPASMGHGVDGLQEHCHTACFFGHWWDLEQWQQFIERIGPVRQFQAGKERAVTLHYIVAADTVDEVVMARRISKRSVQDLLLNYMKRRL